VADQQFLERLDQETAERICRAIQDADYQLRKAKRTLRSRVQAAVADHRERVLEAAAPRKGAGPRAKVDYDKLYAILEKQPLTYDIIKHETGLNDSGVAQVITTLSINCPVWNPAKGVYELLR
jgi:DNA-binding transcriptional regulator GbsR (MarR family)